MTRHVAPVVVVLSLGVGLSACQNEPSEVESPPREPVGVPVRRVVMTNQANQIHAIGRIKNVRESTIASKVMGMVTELRVKAGDTVKAGTSLLRIDDRDARAKVAQARGALAQAEAAKRIARQMLERFERLKASDSASEAKYDEAVFDFNRAAGAVEQATGALRAAESYLRETQVRAPFDATVVDTLIDSGNMASPGVPLVRLEGGSELEFEATVPAQDATAIAIGQTATVQIDIGRGETRDLDGTVTEIVASLDQIAHTNTVRIGLGAAEGVRSGMFGRVHFRAGVRSCPSVFVPESLVVRRGQLSGVFVLDDTDTIRLKLVKEGGPRGEEVEILSGLSNGDRLVLADAATLRDGQPGKEVTP